MITSINNPKIKDLKKLNNKKYRNKTNLFLVEGKHLVDEAYKNNCLLEVYSLEEFNYNIKSYLIDKKVMKYISNLDNPLNIIGICQKKQGKIKGNIMILDHINDPGNLGTIIRSCVAFNIETIILDESIDPYNSKVLRATEGMIFNINIIFSKIEEIIPILKKNNYKIYGTKVNGGKLLKNVTKSSKFAIIMGNEARGVRKDILDKCDEYLYIPMNKKCESLNVGVSASIILYEMVR